MKAAPWVIACAAVITLAAVLSLRDGGSEAEDRALAAEAALLVLRPLADSLRVEAMKRDTVVQRTVDSVRVVVTRERVVQVTAVDTIRAHVDSIGAVALDSLIASEAREDVAQEALQAETYAWGSAWRETALAAQAGWDQERIRGDAWEAVARSQNRQKWYERVGFGLTVGCILVCPRPS